MKHKSPVPALPQALAEAVPVATRPPRRTPGGHGRNQSSRSRAGGMALRQ